MIQIQDVSFHYPAGPGVFKNLNLSIGRGERVGVLGANGAGKTTLMHMIVGLLQPRGTIRVGGLELKKSNLRAIRNMAGLLMQDSDAQLFMPTLLDDVMFGPLNDGVDRATAAGRARSMLIEIGLAGRDQQNAHKLSGGEKRRAALAAVMVMKPEILLLDEPTLNLDPRSRRELIGVLKRMAVTQLIASHDLDLVGQLCSRIVLLDHGCVAAEGPAERILNDAEILEKHGLV